ncbi:head-tail connector protein [Aquabacterium sp. A7-Y]|uniref:head-tail connector protein n=1 Tax=Aquabacterium sp. A7-Y TaxID=1349605 RepID=UPI00223E75E6|nr:head-tail connector protein [Aquabacterium sp. A7-Y]MCW7542010.1 head-tail connector protein [Aquabacterium sp. A7-Y]
MPILKITDATVEPIDLQEAKLHLRVDGDEEDVLIAQLIKTVRMACEAECRRTLIETTLELVADAFCDVLSLFLPRVMEVLSVKYIDPAGAEQILRPAAYQLDKDSEPARLLPGYGAGWPATRPQPGAVRVRYRAGYGTSAADVPPPLKAWMLLHLGHLYQNREASTTGGVQPLPYTDSLLDPYRVWA